jgi:hypothetical protein
VNTCVGGDETAPLSTYSTPPICPPALPRAPDIGHDMAMKEAAVSAEVRTCQ